MDNTVIPTRTLIITSEQDNPKCKEFIELLKNKDLVKNLSDSMVNVMQQEPTGIGKDQDKIFRMDLYDFNMRLIETFLNIDNIKSVIDKVIELVKKLGIPGKDGEQKEKQKGGYIDYKSKYLKYKKKYKMMNGIVTRYYSNNK